MIQNRGCSQSVHPLPAVTCNHRLISAPLVATVQRFNPKPLQTACNHPFEPTHNRYPPGKRSLVGPTVPPSRHPLSDGTLDIVTGGQVSGTRRPRHVRRGVSAGDHWLCAGADGGAGGGGARCASGGRCGPHRRGHRGHPTRPGLDDGLASLRAGDVLVVGKRDRPGRSLHHPLETVTGREARTIGLCSLTEAIDSAPAMIAQVRVSLSGRWPPGS